MEFSLRGLFVGGSAAAAASLVVLYAIPPLIFLPGLPIMQLTGSLFLEPGAGAIILGGFLWIFFAGGFAIAYAALWSLGIGYPSWRMGLLFGTIHGLFGIAGVQILYAAHPLYWPVYMTGGKSLALFLAILTFGLLMGVLYPAFSRRRTSNPA